MSAATAQLSPACRLASSKSAVDRRADLATRAAAVDDPSPSRASPRDGHLRDGPRIHRRGRGGAPAARPGHVRFPRPGRDPLRWWRGRPRQPRKRPRAQLPAGRRERPRAPRAAAARRLVGRGRGAPGAPNQLRDPPRPRRLRRGASTHRALGRRPGAQPLPPTRPRRRGGRGRRRRRQDARSRAPPRGLGRGRSLGLARLGLGRPLRLGRRGRGRSGRFQAPGAGVHARGREPRGRGVHPRSRPRARPRRRGGGALAAGPGVRPRGRRPTRFLHHDPTDRRLLDAAPGRVLPPPRRTRASMGAPARPPAVRATLARGARGDGQTLGDEPRRRLGDRRRRTPRRIFRLCHPSAPSRRGPVPAERRPQASIRRADGPRRRL